MWHVWGTGEKHTGFGGKTWEKDTIRRHRCRWEDIIKIDIQAVGWIALAQDRDRWRALVNTVINMRVP
jgi:hypothetical protein